MFGAFPLWEAKRWYLPMPFEWCDIYWAFPFFDFLGQCAVLSMYDFSFLMSFKTAIFQWYHYKKAAILWSAELKAGSRRM